MVKSVTVQSLQLINDDKKVKEKEIFDKFLEICERRIFLRHKLGYTHMTYVIPPFVIGYSLYNHMSAVTYVRKQLKKGGFTVLVENKYTFHIDWGNTRTKQKKESVGESNEELKRQQHRRGKI